MSDDETDADLKALLAHGHSPKEAAEIIANVKEGDTLSYMWLSLARRRMEDERCAGLCSLWTT